MPRSRNIKPGFFQNENLVELDYEYRLLFIGLWTLADREGRLQDRPKKIKMNLFPADDINIDKGLSELGAHGFVLRYEVDNNKYIQILNFIKHQRPHHQEVASEIPESGLPSESPKLSGESMSQLRTNPPDSLNLIPDTLNEGTKSKKFIPPTILEVQAYCHERENGIDARSFVDHYEANGWMRGKNKIKSWKACVRTWESNNKNKPSEDQFSGAI